ncbi:MAG: SIS domain-containing protein, partial [Acidobacteriota bacterium]
MIWLAGRRWSERIFAYAFFRSHSRAPADPGAHQAEQDAAICAAGDMVAAALAGGGVVHAFGTGHSHMIAEEAFYRAG